MKLTTKILELFIGSQISTKKLYPEKELVFAQNTKDNYQLLSREQESWLYYHSQINKKYAEHKRN